MSSKLVSDDLPIIWKNDSRYEAARTRVFPQNHPARFPKAVVRPTKLEHIIEAVKLAKSLGVRVSVRSGGHSWASWSIRHDTILIDLVDYKCTEYHRESEILEASPSTTSQETCEFLDSYGRFVPAGHCGEVGLGGFILQGGMGLNARGDGWLCSYLIGIEVVNDEGEVLYCDEEQNEDLFWAARGSGPGFPAIVTKFFLKTRPSSPVHRRSMLVYPIAAYDVVMKWFLKVGSDTMPEVKKAFQILPSIDRSVEPLITSSHTAEKGYILGIGCTVRANTDNEAFEKLSILTDGPPSGAILVERAISTNYREEYRFGAQALPSGNRWKVDNVYIDPAFDLTEVCRYSWTRLPLGGTAYWEPMNPVSQETMPDMALSMQTDHYIALYAAYKDPEEDLMQHDWIMRSMKTLLPYAVGSYLGDFDFQTRSSKFWSERANNRLAAIREKYNPEGRICGYLDKDDKSGVKGLLNELPIDVAKI
ncbi:unnamed protein product [Clonostachys rosea]|uniref:FAD-binding PCMH-type domain-containing protein n=1 Tax=Bionectria ochroleuca TaxID=29856 RepID=A0ABY6UJ77_BIOOC|nr:unnamed protein product [Clonostachys rosea]